MKYILTPKGAAEKTKLTYEYILYSYNFYKDARNKILDLFNELEASNVKTVVFWGTGELAEIAYALIFKTSLKLVGVVDFDKVGQNFIGLSITDPNKVGELEFDKIICTEMPEKLNRIENMPKAISRGSICYLHK
ncbi:MAG: hypothetical protein GY705_30780 [Bacteroidetes bacterium]|nr:hypothetical protein [Bacteroidota bacterium]